MKKKMKKKGRRRRRRRKRDVPEVDKLGAQCGVRFFKEIERLFKMVFVNFFEAGRMVKAKQQVIRL